MSECTWVEIDGRFICQAKECTHWTPEGCELGKVSLTCNKNDCRWHTGQTNHCKCMHVTLGTDARCMNFEL
jgi:hypothetical protein